MIKLKDLNKIHFIPVWNDSRKISKDLLSISKALVFPKEQKLCLSTTTLLSIPCSCLQSGCFGPWRCALWRQMLCTAPMLVCSEAQMLYTAPMLMCSEARMLCTAPMLVCSEARMLYTAPMLVCSEAWIPMLMCSEVQMLCKAPMLVCSEARRRGLDPCHTEAMPESTSESLPI